MPEDLRQLLRRAYWVVRRAPRDPEARLVLAELLLRAGRRKQMYRHIERAMRYAPPRWGGQGDLGVLLFKAGEMTAAEQVLDHALASGRIGGEALRTRSALYTRSEQPFLARRMIGAAALLDPYKPADDPAENAVPALRLRCVDRSRYTISWNAAGGCSRRFRSGHFSLQELIDPRAIAVSTLSSYGDSLSTMETLPDCRVILNTIACPDLNPDPLKHAARFLRRFPQVPVINRPEAVLACTREENAVRLGALPGVVTPETRSFENDLAPEEMVNHLATMGFSYPVILRRAGTQTGISMALVEDRDQACRYFAEAGPVTLYAIAWSDRPDGEGLYRKTRAFFIDGMFYPVANLVSDHWQIHSGDRYRVMIDHPQAKAREQAWLADPQDYLGTRAWDALHAIRDEVQLDFFGIDFTLTEDGDVFVFEANAAMRHNYDHAHRFPYTRPYLDRIGRAFSQMVVTRAQAGPGT